MTLLPQGADALLVHGWVNEIQMLLHEHPINAAREARGALAVNSLWLWGAGRLVQPAASLGQAACGRKTRCCAGWRGRAACRCMRRRQAPKTGLPTPRRASTGSCSMPWKRSHAKTRQPTGRNTPSDWERLWFAPLLAALSARRLSKLTLATHHRGQMLRFSIAPSDLWKVWRRRSSLAHG